MLTPSYRKSSLSLIALQLAIAAYTCPVQANPASIKHSMVGLISTTEAWSMLFAALPGSPLSYILAKQLGGDTRLMSSIIAVQTGISMVSLPIVIAMTTG